MRVPSEEIPFSSNCFSASLNSWMSRKLRASLLPSSRNATSSSKSMASVNGSQVFLFQPNGSAEGALSGPDYLHSTPSLDPNATNVLTMAVLWVSTATSSRDRPSPLQLQENAKMPCFLDYCVEGAVVVTCWYPLRCPPEWPGPFPLVRTRQLRTRHADEC